MPNIGKRLVQLVVGLVIGGIMVGNVLPIGLDPMFTVDTSSWGDASTAIWDILPLFFVLVILGALAGAVYDAF